MRPSTPRLKFVLRFTLIVSSLALAMPVRAQSRVATTPAAVLTTPNGKSIGSVHPGASVRVLETRGAYAKVSIDGFVERVQLTAQRSTSSTRIGKRSAVVRSRAASSARSVASFDAGTAVSTTSASVPTGWVKVSREGWVLKAALDRGGPEVAKAADRKGVVARKPETSARKASTGEVASVPSTKTKPGATKPAAVTRATTASAPSKPTPTPVAPASSPLTDSTLVPTANVALRAAPDAKPLATVAQGTSLVPLARDRGWVRVRLEGWVPERDVAPADTAVRMGVSAADLRADPQGTRGKVVRWSVQILAKQKADALRRDLAPDETYLLARGPYEENALLYLVVPPALMVMAKSTPELSQVMITARVRTGRSELVGVPILDLLTITPRK
jgi:hypothetical protein